MIVIIFILGLAVGSFLNVLIYRLHKKESPLIGRSYCPKCKHQLGFWDLVPILSFICLKGRCRYCKERISFQYPIVELATGLLFALVFLKHFGISISTPYTLYPIPYLVSFIRDLFFIAVLVFVFVYDLKYWLVLDKIVVPAALILLVVNIFLGQNFWNLIIAGLVGAGFFFLQFIISRGKWIGGGDIRLGALLGFFFGWPQVAIAIFFAYIVGAIVSLFLVASGKKKMTGQIPLGPFLVVGALITLFYGQQIIEWYLKW